MTNYDLVTSGRSGEIKDHLAVQGRLDVTLCGRPIRSHVNHVAPAITLATCTDCRREVAKEYPIGRQSRLERPSIWKS